MKINNLLKMFMGALVMTFIISSCADDFTEEDLLQAQYDLQQQQQDRADSREDSLRGVSIDALNQAGEFVSLQLTIVDLDGSPVEGASVSLRAAAGAEADEQESTSGANGAVYFDRVAIGGNTINVSGTDITPATLQADFGSISAGIHYTTVDGVIVPTPVTESAVITVISGNAATSEVRGNVSIETDLTNQESEVPQDLVLRADFANALTRNASFTLTYFTSNSGSTRNIGTAEVDNTTGEYSMNVPANINFTVTVPTITADQTIAINGENGQNLDRPEIRTYSANFGSGINTSNIPTVRGARVVFDEPNGGGSGFTIDSYERVPRDIGSRATPDAWDANTVKTNDPTANIVYKFSSLGSGYTESPVVTIDDATAENVYAEAHLDFAINGLTVAEAGSGLGAGEDFELIYDEVYDSADNATGTNEDKFFDNFVLQVNANGAGEITQDSVDVALAEAIENEDIYFDQDDLDELSDYATNLRLVSQGGTTEAVINVTGMKSRVRAIAYQGDNFSNPSFTFSGGGGATQAEVEVLQFPTQWTFELNNENVEPYSSVPAISFDWINAGVNPVISNSTNVQVLDIDGNVSSTESLVSRLEIDSEGQVVYQDAAENNRTFFFAPEAPEVVVQNPTGGTAPTASISAAQINSDGEITGVSVNNNGTATAGSNTGYTSKITAMIEPAIADGDGEGAMLSTGTGLFNLDGSYQWNGNLTVTEGGAGYLIDVNQQNLGNGTEAYSTGGSLNFFNNGLPEGQVTIRNINYGTGNISETIN